MKIALTLPGGNTIPAPSGLKAEFQDLASFLSPLLNIAFYIAVFLAFYYLVWGAYAYLFASGEKENLAKARARIRWALIGLMVVFASYLIATYAQEIFKDILKGGLPL